MEYERASMKPIRIASRGSKLALVQSNYIRSRLEELNGEVEVSLIKISTRGDRDKSDFLDKPDSIGYFTSEVENALTAGPTSLSTASRTCPPHIPTASQSRRYPRGSPSPMPWLHHSMRSPWPTCLQGLP